MKRRRCRRAGRARPSPASLPFDQRGHALAQIGLVERTASEKRDLPFRVDEEVLGNAGRSERFAALVADRAQLRVGGGELSDEGTGVLAVVLNVDAEYRDPFLPVVAVEALEGRRLLAAGPTP